MNIEPGTVLKSYWMQHYQLMKEFVKRRIQEFVHFVGFYSNKFIFTKKSRIRVGERVDHVSMAELRGFGEQRLFAVVVM